MPTSLPLRRADRPRSIKLTTVVILAFYVICFLAMIDGGIERAFDGTLFVSP